MSPPAWPPCSSGCWPIASASRRPSTSLALSRWSRSPLPSSCGTRRGTRPRTRIDRGTGLQYSSDRLDALTLLIGGSPMSSLSHRDRVLAVLNHETPDRIPIDFGGCPASGINLYAYARLKDYLGLPGPVRIQAERSLLAWPDDAILERFDVDLRLVVAYTAEDSRTRGLFDEGGYEKEAEYTD